MTRDDLFPVQSYESNPSAGCVWFQEDGTWMFAHELSDSFKRALRICPPRATWMWRGHDAAPVLFVGESALTPDAVVMMLAMLPHRPRKLVSRILGEMYR